MASRKKGVKTGARRGEVIFADLRQVIFSAVDKFSLRVDIFSMVREPLSVLLVFSWIILSGLDVVEDLDLPDQIEFQNATDAPVAANRSAGPLARNIVESATYVGMRNATVLEQFTAGVAIYTPNPSQKVSKLHKLKRVFLI